MQAKDAELQTKDAELQALAAMVVSWLHHERSGTVSDVEPEPQSVVGSDSHEQTIARLKHENVSMRQEIVNKDAELAAKVRWVVLCAVVRLLVLLNCWLRLGWPVVHRRPSYKRSPRV